MIAGQIIRFIRDSGFTFPLYSTVNDPDEAKNKIILVAIHAEHTTSSLSTLKLTTSSAYQADALTRDNFITGTKIEDVLVSAQR